MSDIAFNKPGAMIALKRGVAAWLLSAIWAYLLGFVGLAAIFGLGMMSLPSITAMVLLGLIVGIFVYGYIIEWTYENIEKKFKLRMGNLDVSKKGLMAAGKRGTAAMFIAALMGVVWYFLIGASLGNPISDAVNGTIDMSNSIYLLSLVVNLFLTGYIIEFTYENIK